MATVRAGKVANDNTKFPKVYVWAMVWAVVLFFGHLVYYGLYGAV